MAIAGAFLSTLLPPTGPAIAQLPATSQTLRRSVSACDVSVFAGTLVVKLKDASPADWNPDPESVAVHPRAASTACQAPSDAAQLIDGGCVSCTVTTTESVAVPP